MSESFQNEVPKARINIKLDLHTGGASKKVELPLKLLVMGDYSNGQNTFMRDGESRVIDFRNTVIVMTSNLGSELIMAAQEAVVEAGGEVTTGILMEAIRPTLIEHFQPALLAR